MKTTIEISSRLLRDAKKLAAQRGVSLKSIIETALRNILESTRRPSDFTLKKASFRGQGIQEGLREGDWTAIRRKIYEGRGE